MPAWAGAQIKTDGSVGPAQTLSGPNYTIPSSLGRLSGGNLFHSFKKFNIRTLGDGTIESATFTQDGPGSISNVIGRVTGGYPSSINGVLRVAIPGANLYLINPKGVVFGPNASLDVPGAVHVGTADYVKFADGTKFQADLSQESTFSVAQPAAFGFLGPAAPIVVNGSVLQVQPKQTLSLVGGDIELHGATLTAPGGRVNLVATASEGEVTLPALDVSSFAALGQVQVLEGSTVDASGDPFSGDGAGGTVAVRGVSLLVDSSTLSSNTFGDVDGTQIGIDLKLTDQLVVSGVSLIGTTSGVVFDPVEGAFVPTGGVGRGGDVSISAGTVLLNGFPLNGFYLLGTMTGSGRGGDVHITATDLTVDGAAVATTGIADGRAGDMVLDLARLTVSNSGLVASAAFGSGPTGDVLVNASESVTLTGVLSGFTIFNNDGDGGLLSIITPLLSMDGGASISSSGQSVGLGANIVITTDRLSMTNGSLITSAGVFGDAGDITVTVTGTATIAGTLEGQPGGILTSSNADAAVGDITMQVGSLSLGGGALIRSGTVSGTLGGGALSIAAQQDISITGGSGIESEAFIGDVGAVSLSARGITLDRGHISTDTLEAGRAGDILLDAQSVTLRNRSFITSTSDLLATGNAGTITIGVPATISSPARPVGRLTLENSRIATEAESAEGGDINILASQIVYLLDSSIKTSVHGGSGSGGNIFIDPQFVVLNSSEIRADAIAGNGGNLDIITDVFLTSDSILSATSRFGVPGTIDVRANITDVSGALVQLPADVLEATTLLRASCATRLADSKTSSLVVATRDGVPREPGGLLPSPVRARPPEEPGFGSADAPAPALRLAGLFLESPCAR
jgi:filamentous hemagglutinin family protein